MEIVWGARAHEPTSTRPCHGASQGTVFNAVPRYLLITLWWLTMQGVDNWVDWVL
jgi:hypothetical protein